MVPSVLFKTSASTSTQMKKIRAFWNILGEGRKHLNVAEDCYLEQHNHGRYFLHGHPKPSASWDEPEIKHLESLPGVYKVESPMCKWEMMSEDQQGIGFVKKETCWLTNSPEVAKCIKGKCEGGHRHVHWQSACCAYVSSEAGVGDPERNSSRTSSSRRAQHLGSAHIRSKPRASWMRVSASTWTR